MQKTCPVCKKRFVDKNHPNRTYCSLKCSSISQKKGIMKICKTCEKKFYVRDCEKSRKFFCSKTCFYKSRKGKIPAYTFPKGNAPLCPFPKGHVPWNKGKTGKESIHFKGIIKDRGYILIYMSAHPFCNKKKYIKRSRLIMERKIGRYLTNLEVVHHINHIRDDDRIENLMLFSNNSEHHKTHFPSEESKKKMSLAHKGHIPWNKKIK